MRPMHVPLAQEQPGDQEAGEREERRDAEESAAQAPVVEREHRHDGERPHAVEPRLVAPPGTAPHRAIID